MADDREDMTETNTRGSDWEVISLTESTYAAAPSPQYLVPAVHNKQEELNKTEQECSEPMLMPKHFVITKAHQVENDVSEIYNDQSILHEQLDPKKPIKDKCKLDSRNDLHGIEKEDDELKAVEKEEILFVSPNYISFADKDDKSLPTIHDAIFEPSWRAEGCKATEDSNDESDDQFSESWWKKQALSVYNHAKGTNTLWSVCVAVAMAGVVFLGQRLWRKEKAHIMQFKWKFSGTSEKTSMMAGPASRFKFPVGGNQRSSGGLMREGFNATL